MAYDINSATGIILAACDKAITASGLYPAHLYHYTNAIGLHGILSSKTIWATQFDFLNDQSEFVYARNLVQEHLRARADALALAVGDMAGLANAALQYPHYVTSFCEDRDLLSQWRGYTQTSDGYGIGFRFAKLSATTQVNPSIKLARLVYARAEQTRLIDSVLDSAVDAYANTDGSDRETIVKVVRMSIIPLMFRFKHELFCGEREWRLIGRPCGQTAEKFRIVRGHFVPYVELPVQPDDIAFIVQGPGSYRCGNKEAITRFAGSCGFFAEVIRSDVPLV